MIPDRLMRFVAILRDVRVRLTTDVFSHADLLAHHRWFREATSATTTTLVLAVVISRGARLLFVNGYM